MERHSQIDHILIHRRQHSGVLDVRSFRATDCNTDPCLVVVKFRDRLAVNKQTTHSVHIERFNFKKINEVDRYHSEISHRFTSFENLDTEVDINRVWETVRESIKISARESRLL
jgi:hypothetical protein